MKRFRLAMTVIALVIILDQLSKWWVNQYLSVRMVLNPYLNLALVENRGISFGAFNNMGRWNVPIFSVVTMVILIILIRWLWVSHGRWIKISLGLIIGGALGNLIDRLRIGAVTDFIDFHIAAWHWPAFNIADSAITIGACLLFLLSVLMPPRAAL